MRRIKATTADCSEEGCELADLTSPEYDSGKIREENESEVVENTDPVTGRSDEDVDPPGHPHESRFIFPTPNYLTHSLQALAQPHPPRPYLFSIHPELPLLQVVLGRERSLSRT